MAELPDVPMPCIRLAGDLYLVDLSPSVTAKAAGWSPGCLQPDHTVTVEFGGII
jgi:hypothetical protein